MADLITAGRSGKYGQIYVEQIGNTGFPDPTEPIALLRAQDKYAARVMSFYFDLIVNDPDVPLTQRWSVGRQLDAMRTFAEANPHLVRTPGTPAPASSRTGPPMEDS